MSRKDQVLMVLEYLREYRTYFHLGQFWGIHEVTVSRITQKIENLLVKVENLRLLGKKKVVQADYQLEVVLVDVQ